MGKILMEFYVFYEDEGRGGRTSKGQKQEMGNDY